MGAHHFCTIKQAEELAHAAYLVGRREEAAERHKMALAFEERIKGVEARMVAIASAAGVQAIPALGKTDRPEEFADPMAWIAAVEP